MTYTLRVSRYKVTFHDEDWKWWMEPKEGRLQRTELTNRREALRASEGDGSTITTSDDAGAPTGTDMGRRTVKHGEMRFAPIPMSTQVNTARLCHEIADRLEVTREGRGGNIALKINRRTGHTGLGQQEGEDREKEEPEVLHGGEGRRGSTRPGGGHGGGLGGDNQEGSIHVRTPRVKPSNRVGNLQTST